MFLKRNFIGKNGIVKKYFSRKSPSSILILGIVIGLAMIAFIVIIAGVGLMAELTGSNSGGPTGNVLSCTSSQLTNTQKQQIQQNLSVYQAAADKAGINWEMLAAIHYRETTLSTTATNPFQITGAKNSGFNINSATEAAEKLKGLAKGSYSVTLTKSSNENDIKLAFLAYNRGVMYKNGGCDVDQSPYVMNNFDAAHKNMVWPNNSCEPEHSSKGDVDAKLGAFTVYASLKGCSSAIVSGNKALPINPKDITRTNRQNSPHGRSISHPDSVDSHDTFFDARGGSNYGTGLPNILGEAVDLYAKTGTPVFAPFDGRVVFADSIRGGSAGNLIIIKSLDGRSFAVLAHIKNNPNKNTQVTAGQKVGELYGLSSGPHLHFELWVDEKPINAGPYGPDWKPENVWGAQKRALGF